MQLQTIRQIIDAAVAGEETHGHYRSVLAAKLPQLQERLVLPDQEPVAALLRFIVRYIRSVPSCLRLVTAVSKRQGFFDYVAPFVRLAEDYFLQPPDGLQHSEGLEALLDEAFLAHRLLEEVNDQHIQQLQRPLLPMDMTEANIIAHHLLGEAFATRLEQLVAFTAQGLLRHEYLWEEVRAKAESGFPAWDVQALEPAAEGIRLRLAS